MDSTMLAEWVARLVRIPSVNPVQAGPKAGIAGEKAMAESLAGCFADLGGEVHLVESDEPEAGDDRPNVYGIWRGSSDRWIALDVHTDTVGVEHMTVDPFDGRIEDGRVYGRGSVDTKASLGVMMAVLEELQQQGRGPVDNLLVAGTISEESGMHGAKSFARWLKGRGLVLDELMVSEPTMTTPIYGHKGGLGIEVVVRGEAAHSSKPHLGKNAIVAAASVINALAAEHDRLQTLEPATELGNGTLTVSIIEGGAARNIVPDRCLLNAGRRLVPPEQPDEEFARLVSIVEQACPLPVEVERITQGHAAFYQQPASEWLARLASWSGAKPDVAPYGTNALHYADVAREIVVMGPGSIDQAHKEVEWVEMTELARSAEVLARWVGSSPG